MGFAQGEEKMEKKLEKMLEVAVKKHLNKFNTIAPGFKIIQKKGKGGCVHILRDNKAIGCFDGYEGNIVFWFHSSFLGSKTHSAGRVRVPENTLTDDDIKDIILRTRGKLYKGENIGEYHNETFK